MASLPCVCARKVPSAHCQMHRIPQKHFWQSLWTVVLWAWNRGHPLELLSADLHKTGSLALHHRWREVSTSFWPLKIRKLMVVREVRLVGGLSFPQIYRQWKVGERGGRERGREWGREGRRERELVSSLVYHIASFKSPVNILNWTRCLTKLDWTWIEFSYFCDLLLVSYLGWTDIW